MPYTFTCDGPCGERYDRAPPFMGELSESFLKTNPSVLTEMYRPGETLTMCRDCSEVVFGSGVDCICPRCGFTSPASELPTPVEGCPSCDDGTLSFKRGART